MTRGVVIIAVNGMIIRGGGINNMMGHKDRLKDGYEYDLVWSKKYHCYMKNISGIAKYIKNKINRRSRREAKKELREL
jgi:hypothetical protein